MSAGRVPAAAAAVLAGLLLAASACSGESTPTTTSTSTSLAPTTTTTTLGRIELEPNGPAFISQGDEGAWVEALQFYLVCTGYGQLSEDTPAITVDGVFGPITADAVAYLQAEQRRVPSGDPDEETFALLARDCSEERTVTFPDRQGSLTVAGNIGPGDDEVVNIEGVQGRVLTVVVAMGAGEVVASLEQVNGTNVQQISLGPGWSGKLPTDSEYRLRITSAATVSYELDLGLARPRFVNIDFGNMRLAEDGFGILSFGDDAERVITRLQEVLGDPDSDSGWATGDAAGRTCLGSNRHLTWVLQPADTGDSDPAVLYVHFSDADGGAQSFAEWAYLSRDPQAVDAGVMELSTEAGISIGRSIAEFVTAYGQPDYIDGSSGMTMVGEMTVGIVSAQGQDVVWFMGAGEDGCEGYE